MDWATLPKELLNTIYSFLACSDLTSAVCVNSTWNSLASNDSTWKEAMFNDSFPHHYSYNQKNVAWRQVVKRHFVTKRNIIKKRCVQFTLGTRCPTSNPRASIVLRNRTASGKYCLLIWELTESHGYSYSTHEHIATELWDLEKRTIIRNYPQQRLELSNGYMLEDDESYDREASMTRYAKFDPTSEELVLDKDIIVTNLNYEFVTVVQNEEPNNSLIIKTWSNWSTKQKFVWVFDLRTGAKILEKMYDDDNEDYMNISCFYGSKIVMRYSNAADRVRVLDVLQDKDVVINESDASCATVAGNDLWIASAKKKCLVKHNLITMERKQYDIKEDITNSFYMTILDGIIWLCTHGLQVNLIDVSSPKCRVLRQIAMHGWDKPSLAQMPNGAISCLGTSYAHILSFRDEDIESPIQILQIETTGENKILNIQHGDLNGLISSYSSHSVSSEIIFEDETQRYCVILSFLNRGKALNNYVENMRQWIAADKGAKVEEHKNKIFKLVYFDHKEKVEDFVLRPKAFGPCWIIYETKVSGAWQRASPIDHWTFFKTKLGLKN